MAEQLQIPVSVVADADADTVKAEHILLHKRDNASILALMDYSGESEWPVAHLQKPD
jgi:hypothetical protein